MSQAEAGVHPAFKFNNRGNSDAKTAHPFRTDASVIFSLKKSLF